MVTKSTGSLSSALQLGLSWYHPGVSQVLEEARRKAETKLAASAGAQGDLRAAVMVKDKVLEDREKV